MFDIGFWELAVIGLTALIVVGPERLPRIARTAGLYVGRARRLLRQVRLEVEQELNAEDLEAARRVARRDLTDLREDLREGLSLDPASGSIARPAGDDSRTEPPRSSEPSTRD